MAELDPEILGENLEIYKDLRPAINTAIQQGRLPMHQEIDKAAQITRQGAQQTGLATSQGTESSIAGLYGEDIASANRQDIQAREARIQARFGSKLAKSERRFAEDVKTLGLDLALDMYTTQFGAVTDTMVNRSRQLTEQDEFNVTKQFTESQNALDRVLGYEFIEKQKALDRAAQKKDKKKGLFGFLGTAAGLLAAPFTGGASLGLTGLANLPSVFGGGSSSSSALPP